MSQLKVKVTGSSRGGKKSWSGTVSYPGLSGKLTKSDSTTTFSSEAGVRAAAQRLGEKLNTKVEFDKPAALKAAKKKATVKKTTKKSEKTASKATSSTPSSNSGNTGCPSSNW